MNIEVFVIAWNEEKMIEQFIDWYSFADSITVLDNYSTDRTCEIAESRGCKILKYGIPGVLDNDKLSEIKANCWLESKADWVIVCDVDEFIWHDDFQNRKIFETNASIIRCLGYQMVSDKWNLNKNIHMGVHDSMYNKCLCFRPDRITNMNWGPGCHLCEPEGQVSYHDGSLLLHYKMVGRQELKDRYKEYNARRSQNDINNAWGWQYALEEQKIDESFNDFLSKAEKVW